MFLPPSFYVLVVGITKLKVLSNFSEFTLMNQLTSFCWSQLKAVIPRFIPLVEVGPYVGGLIPLPPGILLIKHLVLPLTINLICQPFDLEVLGEH